MIKSLVQNSNDVVVNSIEWDEDSSWSVPEGFRLEDPKAFPYYVPPIASGAPERKLIGEMTAVEFKQATAAKP